MSVSRDTETFRGGCCTTLKHSLRDDHYPPTGEYILAAGLKRRENCMNFFIAVVVMRDVDYGLSMSAEPFGRRRDDLDCY